MYGLAEILVKISHEKTIVLPVYLISRATIHIVLILGNITIRHIMTYFMYFNIPYKGWLNSTPFLPIISIYHHGSGTYRLSVLSGLSYMSRIFGILLGNVAE
jgi:hypothetical protein